MGFEYISLFFERVYHSVFICPLAERHVFKNLLLRNCSRMI